MDVEYAKTLWMLNGYYSISSWSSHRRYVKYSTVICIHCLVPESLACNSIWIYMGLSENVGENPIPYSDLSHFSIISCKKFPQMAGYIYTIFRHPNINSVPIISHLYPQKMIENDSFNPHSVWHLYNHSFGSTENTAVSRLRFVDEMPEFWQCMAAETSSWACVWSWAQYVKSFTVLVGHVWGHVWPPKKMTMIKLPPVKWHGIVLSCISIKDCSHERRSFSREQSFSPEISVEIAKQFYVKKMSRRIRRRMGKVGFSGG